MSTSGMTGEEIDKQAALASAALRKRLWGWRARRTRHAWAVCGGALHRGPRCAIRHLRRRTCSGPHARLLPLESMAGEMLLTVRKQGLYYGAALSACIDNVSRLSKKSNRRKS